MANSFIGVEIVGVNSNKGYALNPGLYVFNVAHLKGAVNTDTNEWTLRYAHTDAVPVEYEVESGDLDTVMADLSEERGRFLRIPFFRNGSIAWEVVQADDILLLRVDDPDAENVIAPLSLANGTGRPLRRDMFLYEWQPEAFQDDEDFANTIAKFDVIVGSTTHEGTVDNNNKLIEFSGLGTDDPNDGVLDFEVSPLGVLTENGELVYQGGNITWTDDTTQWLAAVTLTSANGESEEYSIVATVA